MNDATQVFEVENTIEALGCLTEDLARFARTSGLDDMPRRTLMMVVEELFTNTVHYGYDDGVVDTISISVERVGDRVDLVIRDNARAFDVARCPPYPDRPPKLEDIEVGGLGLLLVHNFAHSVASRRDGATNITEVVLPV